VVGGCILAMRSAFPPPRPLRLYFLPIPSPLISLQCGRATLDVSYYQGDDPFQKYSLVCGNTVQTVFLRYL